MTSSGKQLSNPFSTGGGGPHFEAHVQALFATLMLTRGNAPCLPNWPITKIKLQGKFAGYGTDDLVVFVTKPDDKQQRKMLAEIKHTIRITENDAEFGEVIHAAWNDFNNTELFTKGKDVLTLITGQLSATDISDVCTILEWARSAENAQEYFFKVDLSNFSSDKKRAKLQAFQVQLERANGGINVSSEDMFEFFRHFYLLGYDLGAKSGVTLSMLHSLIGQYAQNNVSEIWARIVDEVQNCNKNAGTIKLEDLPGDLREHFQPLTGDVPIPAEYTLPDATEWSQHQYAAELAVCALVGAWSEDSEADRKIIELLSDHEFPIWLKKIGEFLQIADGPLTLKNKVWSVKDRKGLWDVLAPRIYDMDLDKLQECVLHVLGENDPQFELPPEQRYAADLHDKALVHSRCLRKGLAEGLALAGTRADALTNCSQGKVGTVVRLSVRRLLENADWVLWGSLNDVVTLLAEASPEEFLDAVGHALNHAPCPFVKLFEQEGTGFTGSNYMTGLLWGLELLAWDPVYHVQACVILGMLAEHDPGGQWANRPTNSLTTILLPWRPQTSASMEKRKAVLSNLIREVPDIAWELLISLLPGRLGSSSGTYKPKWRESIPPEWNESVTQGEYWSAVEFYACLAIEIASTDAEKLGELVQGLDKLPKPSLERMMEFLSSPETENFSDTQKVQLWRQLMTIATKHRRHSNAEWAFPGDLVTNIEKVADKFRPQNLLNLYQRLFSEQDHELFEKNENFQEERQKLTDRRQQAIEELLSHGGIDVVIQFAGLVKFPWKVGDSLGALENGEVEKEILRKLLLDDDNTYQQLAGGYVWGRQFHLGWDWVDGLDIKDWTTPEVVAFLIKLPFVQATWERVAALLGDAESEYWSSANVNPYLEENNLNFAIEKLLEAGRLYPAIACLHQMIHDKKEAVDTVHVASALLSAVATSEEQQIVESFQIEELIKFLQDSPSADPGDLFRVEWAYLPLLDGHSGAPLKLEEKLASDPEFFWEVIQFIYRPKNKDVEQAEPTEKERSMATNGRRLLGHWKTPPGTKPDGSFAGDVLRGWVDTVKKISTESGHLEVAQSHVGHVLFYSPSAPDGLWIDPAVAELLNEKDSESMRSGFMSEVFNSRGAYHVDPTGKPERELAEGYRKKAEDIEDAGFHRFAVTLKEIANWYDQEAERIIADFS